MAEYHGLEPEPRPHWADGPDRPCGRPDGSYRAYRRDWPHWPYGCNGRNWINWSNRPHWSYWRNGRNRRYRTNWPYGRTR